MSVRTITLLILRKKQSEAEAYMNVRVYAEWQCGQSDHDNEADEHFDKLMKQAIEVYEDNSVYWNMSDETRTQIEEFVASVLEEFTTDSKLWLSNY